jgi:5-methylcytosine-specific restriction endonuclease McrA
MGRRKKYQISFDLTNNETISNLVSIEITIPDEIVDKAERHKFYMREYRKQWEPLHPNRRDLKQKAAYMKEYQKAWYIRNREKKLAQNKDWVENNPEKTKEIRIRSKKKNPESVKASQQKYWSKNKGKLFEKRNRRRLRKFNPKRGNRDIIEKYVGMVRTRKSIPCYYCQKNISGKDAHIDHVVALAKSGNHAIENLCVSCAECNLTKPSKSISEWKTVGQSMFNL